MLINGDFESGPGVGWTEFSSGGLEIISTARPHAGNWSARECGDDACTEYIQQQITIPSNGRLTYWWYMDTQEGTTRAYDTLQVQAYSTTGQLLATLRT